MGTFAMDPVDNRDSGSSPEASLSATSDHSQLRRSQASRNLQLKVREEPTPR